MCRGLGGPGTLVTWPWLRLSMIYCCALRLWSQICVTCRSCWFPDSVALSCCVGTRCLGLEGWLHTFEMVTKHFANPNLSELVAKCRCLGFVVWAEPVCVPSLPQPWPRWRDFRLFTNINGCRAGWGYACLFPVCGWFKWPSSGVVGFYDPTNRQDVAGFDFASVSGCDQLILGPTHARGGTLDLLMTDIPALVRIALVALCYVFSHLDGSGGSKLVC